MENSETLYSDKDMMQRAINNLRFNQGEAPVARWVFVKRLFAGEAGIALAICIRYGFRPGRMIAAVGHQRTTHETL